MRDGLADGAVSTVKTSANDADGAMAATAETLVVFELDLPRLADMSTYDTADIAFVGFAASASALALALAIAAFCIGETLVVLFAFGFLTALTGAVASAAAAAAAAALDATASGAIFITARRCFLIFGTSGPAPTDNTELGAR